MNKLELLKFLYARGWTFRNTIIAHFKTRESIIEPLLDSLWKDGYIEQEYGQNWCITPDGKKYVEVSKENYGE